MKQSILLSAIFISSIFINSQVNAQRLALGVKTGFNVSSITGTPDSKPMLGPMNGVFVLHQPFEKTVGFSTGAYISPKGVTYKDPQEPGVIEDRIRLKYLSVPFHLSFFCNSKEERKQWYPRIFLGPTISYLLNREEADAQSVTVDYNKFGLGATVGAGLGYAFAESFLLNLDMRYTIGTTDIRDNIEPNWFPRNYHNHAITTSFGIAYMLD